MTMYWVYDLPNWLFGLCSILFFNIIGIVGLFSDTPSFSMHMWLTLFLATLMGLMIFLIGTLDNPFRGRGGVSPIPLELVYQQLMK